MIAAAHKLCANPILQRTVPSGGIPSCRTEPVDAPSEPVISINLGDVLAKRAMRNPDIEALVDTTSGRRMTYAELDRAVNRTAHALDDLGVRIGDRVGLLLMNCTEFIEVYYGAAKIGGVVVLMNWRLVADELEHLLRDSGATVLVFGAEFTPVVAELRDRATTEVQCWVCVGANEPDFASSYEALTAVCPPSAPDIRAGDDDVLCLCYSSGTTGRPKGAMLTHAGQLWGVLSTSASADDFHLRDRYLCVMPLFHLGGINPMETALYAGSTVVLMRLFDASTTWEVIARERITSGLVVPSMLNALLTAYNSSIHDHSSLRYFWVAGAPCPVVLIEQCFAKGIGLLQSYGLTEAGGPGTMLGGDDALRKIGSSGKAYLFTETRVVRPDDTQCDPNERGEIVIRARHLMKGYWNNPDATETAIVDGWLHTGDVAVTDEDGFVTVQDRIKDMIISGGENIYPAELENVILGHPHVREVAVISQPSPRWGESPLAVVVRTNDSLSADALLAWCDGKVARYKLPRAIEFIDEIPRNPTGKALKRILRDRFPGPASP